VYCRDVNVLVIFCSPLAIASQASRLDLDRLGRYTGVGESSGILTRDCIYHRSIRNDEQARVAWMSRPSLVSDEVPPDCKSSSDQIRRVRGEPCKAGCVQVLDVASSHTIPITRRRLLFR
jgi:hypothetical protein